MASRRRITKAPSPSSSSYYDAGAQSSERTIHFDDSEELPQTRGARGGKGKRETTTKRRVDDLRSIAIERERPDSFSR